MSDKVELKDKAAIAPTVETWLASIGVQESSSQDSLPFTLKPLKLGDELDEAEVGDRLYLVCEGRVRLLSVDPQRQRDRSAAVIETGEWFGSDRWLYESTHCISYRAIAASDGLLAQISFDGFQTWYANLPEAAQNALQQQARDRQCQLFLKTQTPLKSLSSHQIRQLVPLIVELNLRAGSEIDRVAPATAGRFWLRSGEIEADTETVATGTSWGHPQPTPANWTARTDVTVYHLPIAQWSTAVAIAPSLNHSGVSRPGTNFPSTRPIPAKAVQPAVRPVSLPAPHDPAEVESPPLVLPKPLDRKFKDWLSHYPLVRQQSSSDCGAACLATIGQYWGKRFSINTIRDRAEVGRSGASLKSLAKAAESLGFQARPVRASLGKLAEQSNPWIAHWQGIHYVVIYTVERHRVLVADPADSKRWVSRQEFLTHWTGFALMLEPTERLKTAPNEKRSLGKFVTALLPYKNLGLQIIGLSVLIQVFALVSPLFTQIILDQVVVQRSQSVLTVFCIGALLFGLGTMALSSTRRYLLAYLSNRLSLTLVSGFINHALMLPLQFFESRRVGDIITRVQENQKIQRFLIGQVLLAWLNLVTGIVYLGLMLYYNTRLTILVLALIPPMVIFTLVATPFLRKLSRERFNAASDQNSVLVEMMSGISTVKAAAAERELRWRWEDRFTNQLNVGFKGQKFGITLEAIGGTIEAVGGILLLWYGASLVINGNLTIGQFVAFNMMKGKVLSPVMALTNLWDELQEVLISVERLNDVFETPMEEVTGSSMLVLPPIKGDVRFDNVTFRYGNDEERNTLQNISFDVEAGQTIALVGRSGSGKSTLVKLMQGLYYPTQGRITIDGHDIRHVAPQSLRSQLGVVPQECFLFSGTIAENIALYTEEIPLEAVVEAAQFAEAHSFIQDMPLGYNTTVGERGASLSGGQQQRIAIARALLGNPRILILDEATSSLDTESERRFQENLARITRDRTTFIIAHRLSTVRHADKILVLDRGLIVEQGNHEELMAIRGLYYHLACQQLDL